jgi:zinc transport system ATP-binding protein
MGSLLSVQNLRIGYGSTAILPAVSFELQPGQVTSIVGHNGSGKSTLLKTLLGLQPKVSGEIVLAGNQRVGYVPQREAMDPIYPVQVRDVVETGRYGLKGVGRWLKAEDKAQVQEAMKKTGVHSLQMNLFRTLSGGEQQRALLARALCTEPTILILDEPTASMDEKGAHEAMTLTLKIAQERNAAVLMVNHFIDLVIEVSQQVVFLDRDRQLVQVGAPQQIFSDRVTKSLGGGS